MGESAVHRVLVERVAEWVAAEFLGLSYHQLRGKMKKHGLDRRPVRDRN